MEIVEKKGTSCRRLVWEHKFTMTKDEILISNEAFLKGVSTRFGLRTIEKYIESLHCINCSSFQNLRLGSITLEMFAIVIVIVWRTFVRLGFMINTAGTHAL